MLKTVSIIIEGLVQGVYFRQTTKIKASESGIAGEVRNKSDGSVQIIATGTEEQLQHLIDWCHKGPDQAVVTQVKVEKMPLQNFRGFNIVRGK